MSAMTTTTFSSAFVKTAKNLLPMPFTIAILLTFMTFLLALVFTRPVENLEVPYIVQLGSFWEKGFWGFLEFAMQMMLMLVLGHVLALTEPVDKLIKVLVKHCTNTAKAASIVTLATTLVGLFNWGLGLIFGAILARKVGEHAYEKGYPINYPMVGGAGYVALMVWHGGLSGSAPIKVAEPNHFLVNQMGQIPLSETVFSTMNVVATFALIICLPLAMYILGKKTQPKSLEPYMSTVKETIEPSKPAEIVGAEKLDHSRTLAYLFGGVILGVALYKALWEPKEFSLGFLTPNFINFALLGIGIVLYGNLFKYAQAVEEAITGATGIMLQFPLYAGIAGIMQYSHLIEVFSQWMISVSNTLTFPLFTFYSAAIVNVFVPSGGGQWVVQGPIVANTAAAMGASQAKCVMALAYGDQLTNMMQPFWALPLLGITRLTAQDILPYSLFLMGIGFVILTTVLLLF